MTSNLKDDQVALVARRLGAGAGALYARVLALLEIAPREATSDRSRIRAMIIELMCGAYHDYRSESARPKADLATALRALESPEVAPVARRLALAAERGEFDECDAERRRWVDRIVVAGTRERVFHQITPAINALPVSLSPRQADVFHWMARFVDVYKRAPRESEIVVGVELPKARVAMLLGQLEAKGLAAADGRPKAWFPTVAA